MLAATLLLGCTAELLCTFADPGHNVWQKPNAVVEALTIKPGATVADLRLPDSSVNFVLAD